MTKRILALAGPTGSGKTDWSLKLAAATNAAIIVADSRTVYRDLDIGTGKVSTEYPTTWSDSEFGPVATVNGVDHYGLDLVPPTDTFTAAQFQQLTRRVCDHLWVQGKLPFLVGGTGLYIDTILRGFVLPTGTTPPDEWIERTTIELAAELQQRDPVTSSALDLKNRRRVERALAYHLQTGQSLHAKQTKTRLDFTHALFVIDRPRSELYSRIDARVDRWVEAGLFEEVRGLVASGISLERIQRFGQVYRAALKVVDGQEDVEEFRTNLRFELHAYARKQLTWWRRHKDVHWISEYTELEKGVRSWLGMA